jgi:hypothetical protein
MYNGKTAIATALSTDAQLILLVPKARMFDGIAVFTDKPIYPYVTYEEIGNTEALHSDDEEIESEVTFRFHIWNTASNSTIAGHINRILKSIGFGRNYAMDMDEQLETGEVIKHKIMSYTGIFTI